MTKHLIKRPKPPVYMKQVKYIADAELHYLAGFKVQAPSAALRSDRALASWAMRIINKPDTLNVTLKIMKITEILPHVERTADHTDTL
jgi:hypothetical protein